MLKKYLIVVMTTLFVSPAFGADLYKGFDAYLKAITKPLSTIGNL